LGINPGHFDSNLTGVAFTDPVSFENKLKIKKPELSGEFVCRFIGLFGGVEKFYSRFFIGAVYSFGLIKNGKNFNYYDNKFVYAALKTKILESLCKQINFGAKNSRFI